MNKLQKAIIIAVVAIAFVAFMDFQIYPAAFYWYSIALGGIIALVYYVFKPDKSEALSVFLAFIIMFMSGLEDLIFYIIRPLFQAEPWGIPATMDHLFTHPVIGQVASMMGLTTVTPQSLIVSVALGGVATYITYSWLKKQSW